MDVTTLRSSCGPEGDALAFATLAAELERDGRPDLAATAYDRAFGLNPANEKIRQARSRLLDSLAVQEHGLVFRYVPAGSFLMGSIDGDPDELPVHPVEVSAFWIAETPLNWSAWGRLEPPPELQRLSLVRRVLQRALHKPKPKSQEFRADLFHLHQENKIRLQYCEDRTLRARDWHAHDPGISPRARDSLFGRVGREDLSFPWTYEHKPMVAVSWQAAVELCTHVSSEQVVYRLPTEAEWEKAARGGLIGFRYPWGHALPDDTRCDFNHFDRFSIQPYQRFAANHYGLRAMSGGVWEWTADWYDAQYYGQCPRVNPTGPSEGHEKVLRGGSWSDCAAALTVSFRYSSGSRHWREGEWGGHLSPNIGFRICRVLKQPDAK